MLRTVKAAFKRFRGNSWHVLKPCDKKTKTQHLIFILMMVQRTPGERLCRPGRGEGEAFLRFLGVEVQSRQHITACLSAVQQIAVD